MSASRIGIIVMLVVSLLLGAGIGEVFFGLFLKTIPPMAISGFNQGTAHVMFIAYGAGSGVVLFVWGLLAMFIGRSFRAKDAGAGSPR